MICTRGGWSWKAIDGAATCHEFHATILNVPGINHEKLMIRHDGIDRRLPDLHGQIVPEFLS